jgi:hypothetical protein
MDLVYKYLGNFIINIRKEQHFLSHGFLNIVCIWSAVIYLNLLEGRGMGKIKQKVNYLCTVCTYLLKHTKEGVDRDPNGHEISSVPW